MKNTSVNKTKLREFSNTAMLEMNKEHRISELNFSSTINKLN